MLVVGSYNELVVEREVDFGLYLGTGADEVLLPTKYIPEGTRVGDRLKVFVYTDSEDRPIATTLKPAGCVGDYVWLEVVDTATIGAFLNWGLEKDLLVPRNEQTAPMKRGQRHVVRISLDRKSGRVYGSARISALADTDTSDLEQGQEVDLLIYGVTDIGIMAVVNQRYSGMLYKTDVFETLKTGDRRLAYIRRVRDDGKIDLVLKKPGFDSVEASRIRILDALKEEGGFLPLHDKSSPDDIKACFAMSKKEFKRSIGTLYKEGLIRITPQGIFLIS